MKWKKKLMSIIFAGTMALGLVSCGGAGGSSESADGGGSGSGHSELTGKIVIYTSMYEDIIDNMKDPDPWI